MFPTPLQTALLAQASSPTSARHETEYRGATVAARHSDPREEFAAAQTGCAIYDAGFRSVLLLEGADRTRWLNGMVTNNIRDLAAGHGVYAFLLNAQGRILGDMQVFNMGDKLEVVTDRSQVEKIIATFDHFIIMDDVDVKNIGEEWTTLGLTGPRSREVLLAAGIEVPELQPLQFSKPQCNCECDCLSCTVVRLEDAPHETYEIWLSPNDVHKTWQALIAAGAVPLGSEALEMLRIAAGVPLYGVDIRDRDLPQETEQMRALNFNKGCYVGQEIVERIRSRGNVHRRFSGFLFESVVNIGAGEKITAGEKEVGEITSVAALPFASGEQTLALGYIRREAGLPGREVTIGGARATVAALPLGNMLPHGSEEALLHRA
jgi:folate-binding protein YgfZ